MTPHMTRLALAAVLALSLAACGGDKTTEGGDSSGGAPTASSPLLTADMPDAVNVFSARKKAEGDDVVVFGRVRAEVDGSAAFTIIDTAIEYCGQGAEKCGCPTPWDYCCEEGKDIIEASLPVEVRDANGDVIDVTTSDIRLLDLVALKGTLGKTESGDLILVVNDGWFRRDRPALPEGIQWPE